MKAVFGMTIVLRAWLVRQLPRQCYRGDWKIRRSSPPPSAWLDIAKPAIAQGHDVGHVFNVPANKRTVGLWRTRSTDAKGVGRYHGGIGFPYPSHPCSGRAIHRGTHPHGQDAHAT